MSSAAATAVKNQAADASQSDAPQALTDGFQLVIDALKLNDIETIYTVPGIPISDLLPHGAGRRHPRHLVPARAERRQCRRDRRLPDEEAGHLPHGVGSGLPERSDGAGQRHHQLLSDDPDQRVVRARDRRSAAGRLRRDGPARHREAPLQGGLPRAARPGHRHRRGARDPRRRLGPSGRRLSRPAGQAVLPGDGRGGGTEVARQGHRPGAGAASGPERCQARARRAEERQASPDRPRQGCRLCAGRRRDPRAGREERHSLPADEHGQGPVCRTRIRSRRAPRARWC